MIGIYIIALLVTIAVEFGIVFLLVKGDWRITLLYVALINMLTAPIANFLVLANVLNFISAEIAVVLVEGVLVMLLFEKEFFHSLMISFAANIVTALLSFVF